MRHASQSSARSAAAPASRRTLKVEPLEARALLSASFQELTPPPGHGSFSATAISADGSIVVGSAGYGYSDSDAFRWTNAGGMARLGPRGAVDVSADGSVVLVSAYTGNYLWTATGTTPVPGGVSGLSGEAT